MPTDIEPSIVRIFTNDNRIVGAGFLVNEKWVLTCAHVIARAFNISEENTLEKLPDKEIYLDFPFVAGNEKLVAKVIKWKPVKTDGSGDIACLELRNKPPKNSCPARLIVKEDVWEHKFRAYGFPKGYDTGLWVIGKLLSKNADGCVQIEGIENIGYFVEPGFSGTAIWDEEVKAVIGMAIKADKRTELRVAFIIQISAILKELPELEGKIFLASGGLPQYIPFPKIELEIYQSIMLRPFHRRLDSRSPRKEYDNPAEIEEIDHIFERWLTGENIGDPLILILDFAPDVLQTLIFIKQKIAKPANKPKWPQQNICRVAGEILIDQMNQGIQQSTSFINSKEFISFGIIKNIPCHIDTLEKAIEEFSKSLPTLFLIDFSQVKINSFFLNVSNNRVNYNNMIRALSDFCSWMAAHGHRVVIGLPRFMLALLKIHNIDQNNLWVFISAELFSHEYNYRADYCQKRIGKTLLPNNFLRKLLSANSNALPPTIAKFILNLPKNTSILNDMNNPSSISTLLELACYLTREGFYEIAYRLEVYCRTILQQANLISLNADIIPSSKDGQQVNIEEEITGFVEKGELIPASVYQGMLTGEAGAGKSTVLTQIEHLWSIPQINIFGAKHPCWIPFLIPLSIKPSSALSEKILVLFEDNSNLEFNGHSYELTCHTLFANISSCSNLHWLFNSPIYFLLDSFDEISSSQRVKLANELINLKKILKYDDEFSIIGYIIAARFGEITTQFPYLTRIELRPMSINQIREFLEKKEGRESLTNLLSLNDNFISPYLNNPYLLTLIWEKTSAI